MLLTRSPLHTPRKMLSLDLHVLSTPPAFVLSQDQTLRRCLDAHRPESRRTNQKRYRQEYGWYHEFNLTDGCLLTILFNPKESHSIEPKPDRRGNLALTIVHAVEFSRIGRTPPSSLPTTSLGRLIDPQLYPPIQQPQCGLNQELQKRPVPLEAEELRSFAPLG